MNKNLFNIRKEFLGLLNQVNNKDLIYFDNAATSQMPQCVLEEINNYYKNFKSNINRSAHSLSAQATQKYTQARTQIKNFLQARCEQELVFTRGTTESLNLLAHSLGELILKPGDEIILTQLEHHANIVPWYLLAKKLDINLKIVPLTKSGILDINIYKNYLASNKAKLASFCHVSNTLGIINPVKILTNLAREAGVISIIDGAQAVPHLKINLQELDPDFYVFSGHKAYGPTGIGILYARHNWLNKLPPYQSGGDMIHDVDFDQITFTTGPQKFEAGTPNIAGALGMARALEFLGNINFNFIHEHEKLLHNSAMKILLEYPEIKILGPTNNNSPKIGVISFVIPNIHPHDIATVFDQEGIAIRSGHMCTQPLLKYLGVKHVSRISFGIYNNITEVHALKPALDKIFRIFKT